MWDARRRADDIICCTATDVDPLCHTYSRIKNSLQDGTNLNTFSLLWGSRKKKDILT